MRATQHPKSLSPQTAHDTFPIPLKDRDDEATIRQRIDPEFGSASAVFDDFGKSLFGVPPRLEALQPLTVGHHSRQFCFGFERSPYPVTSSHQDFAQPDFQPTIAGRKRS